jgi:hypothetical protein
MAAIRPEIICTLRLTAEAILKSAEYQWGHMGLCNCGFLAQQITRLQKAEIHTRAMQGNGDWREQLNDYCPASGMPMDELISDMLAFGFDVDDLKHLERLSKKEVLAHLPLHQRNLMHNCKADVVTYLLTWADMLEEELINRVQLPEFDQPVSVPA